MPLLPQISPGVIVPEARGKAAAMDRWLAQGGKPGRSGKFRKGPMKGMTYDQAHQKFQGMWSGASPAIKDKYAARAGGIGDLSPSERAAYGMEAVPSTPAKPVMTPADAKKSRMDYYKRIGMAPKTPVTPAPPPASKGDLSAQAMGTPEQQAQVAAMMGEGEKYGTADINGMSGFAAANAMANSRDMTGDRAAIETVGKVMTAKTPPPGAPTAPKTPVTPAQAPVVAAPSVNDMQTDERMHAQGKVNGGPTPVVKAPPAQSLPTVKPARVNSLTGLPMGYRPGDEVAPKFKQAADASMERQVAADPRLQAGGGKMVSGPPSPAGVTTAAPVSTVGAPRAVPGTPAPSYAERVTPKVQPKVANPDDPRKFFTGRVLPLNQLVNPASAPSSGYQVGGVGPSGGRVLSVRPARR